MNKIFKAAVFGLGFLGGLILLSYLFFGRGGEAAEISWGISFDASYAESLGLDWKKTYLSLLDEVGVDHFRLVAFWNLIEPQKDQFDFSALDFQMQEAQKRGARVILSIGRRLPRWPECHIPAWADALDDKDQQEEVMDLIAAAVSRYRESPHLEFWQVENEPFVWFFKGDCPRLDLPFLKREIDAVSSLDPNHPIILTESGELSTWIGAASLGDNLGISMYRNIYDTVIKRYISHALFFPQQYYRIKANFYRKIGLLKNIFVSELQAEPWGTKPITQLSLEEQYFTLSPENLRANISFARSSGFERFYLWGAEWWFYVREKFGVSDFVEIAKELW